MEAKQLTLTAPENVFEILKDCVTRCKDGQSMEVAKTLLAVYEMLENAKEHEREKEECPHDS